MRRPRQAALTSTDLMLCVLVAVYTLTCVVCFRVCVCVSQAYEQWLRPTVLVGLFAPPEKISAASMLETVYCFSVAHQSDMGGTETATHSYKVSYLYASCVHSLC
jgi:hypothetical protein